MESTIKLSDMLMMQMVGGLEEFSSHVISDTLPKGYVKQIQSLATTPNLFKDIVKKTIATQFGNPLTSLRELGQNARDAYREDREDKTIEFIVKEHHGRQFVSARDYGVGMSPDEVFTMLLVPYNSGKESDPKKVGEHGIGFFSNFDISDHISVKTRNGTGLTTTLHMDKQEDDWNINYGLSDVDFEGTEVTMRLNKAVSEIEVYQTLVKNLGFLNSGFVVSYNGEKLNQLPNFYEEIGSSEVTNKEEELKLGFSEKGLRDNSFFRKTHHPGNLVMTQNGLYVKNPSVSELIEDEVLEDLVSRMVDIGYNFWVELPNNIGLTKGRNNIITKDSQEVSRAATEAFSQGVLEKILDDPGLVYALDTQIADVVDNILKQKVNQKTLNLRKVVSGLNDIYHFLNDTEIDISLKNFKLNFGISRKRDNDEKEEEDLDPNAARKRRYAKVFNYDEISGFSGDLIKKRIVPAVRYDNGKNTSTKVSVLDMIDHYCDGTLFTTNPNLLIKGQLYVDGTNIVVSRVIRHLDSQGPDKSYEGSLILDLKEIWFGGRKGLSECLSALSGSTRAFNSSLRRLLASDEERTYDFRRTKRKKFEEMVEKHQVGLEYLTLFDNLEYVDGIISEANNIAPAKIRLFGKQGSQKNETAHTNGFSMGFNVYDATIGRYLDSTRSAEYNESDARSLVELVIHEKAHDVMEESCASATHGKDFYAKEKKQLRENFYDYCKREGIDPYQGLNAELKPIETEKLSPRRLKTLIKQFSYF